MFEYCPASRRAEDGQQQRRWRTGRMPGPLLLVLDVVGVERDAWQWSGRRHINCGLTWLSLHDIMLAWIGSLFFEIGVLVCRGSVPG